MLCFSQSNISFPPDITAGKSSGNGERHLKARSQADAEAAGQLVRFVKHMQQEGSRVTDDSTDSTPSERRRRQQNSLQV